jgi:hypothetical protein
MRVLDFFGVDLAEKSAAALGEHFEEKLIGKHPPGFYRLDLGGEFSLKPSPTTKPSRPTPAPSSSSCTAPPRRPKAASASCGMVATSKAPACARASADLRRPRFRLEHRTLTESPIDNALALAKRLPAGAEIHLVSHSRGGLVGEVLCLADCADLAKILNAERCTPCSPPTARSPRNSACCR